MARSTQTDSPKIRSISYNVGRPLSDIRYRQGPQSYLTWETNFQGDWCREEGKIWSKVLPGNTRAKKANKCTLQHNRHHYQLFLPKI